MVLPLLFLRSAPRFKHASIKPRSGGAGGGRGDAGKCRTVCYQLSRPPASAAINLQPRVSACWLANAFLTSPSDLHKRFQNLSIAD